MKLQKTEIMMLGVENEKIPHLLNNIEFAREVMFIKNSSSQVTDHKNFLSVEHEGLHGLRLIYLIPVSNHYDRSIILAFKKWTEKQDNRGISNTSRK